MNYMECLGKSIGKAIVKLREERNMTAKDLAKLTNKTQSYISKLETGNVRNPRRETIKEILSGMNLTVDEIDEILYEFYIEEEEENKQREKILFKKSPQSSESNVDFIQKSVVQKTKEIPSKNEVQNDQNEEIIFQFSNRHDLSIELTAISHLLHETATSLINRTMLDVRYDSIKNSVNQASDRIEIFKTNYALYVEKLIRDGNNIQT
jgi:transcriptional regulator with XRE-family HTH domain